MSEERTIKYTEWKPCDGEWRYCRNCRERNGQLLKRTVTGRDGDSHTEYKIECADCGSKSDVHFSRNLTIFDWEGRQEEPDMLRHRHCTPEKHGS